MKSRSTVSIRSLLVAGALSAAAAGALAQEATEFDFNAQPSQRTRAEVQAEVAQARANGTLVVSGEATEFAYNTSGSTLSRAQVVAEAIEARRLGLLGHGDINPVVATAEQQRLIAAAGRRAVEQHDTAQQ
jgi:hypothetical protein